jgi:hypothetical protein
MSHLLSCVYTIVVLIKCKRWLQCQSLCNQPVHCLCIGLQQIRAPSVGVAVAEPDS